MNQKNWDLELSHYIKVGEPNEAFKAKTWKTAIGLQADKVAVRIIEILSDKSFNFNSTKLISIHKRLFSGIYKHAGKIRNYNIETEEWVLKGDTVIDASYETIMDSL